MCIGFGIDSLVFSFLVIVKVWFLVLIRVKL